MKILIIEDEYNLADAIGTKLEKENFSVDISNDGEDGLYNGLTNIYDLIILDVMLPKVDGFTILKKLKEENIKSKIIMLTAKSLISDKLEGLENGADDYMTKPFHIEELIARINIQLFKNNNLHQLGVLEYSDLRLYIRESKILCTKTNEEVSLVCKELQLLEYFINNSNQILSKEQIYDRIWGIDSYTESNNLEVYLSFIRKKLKAIGSSINIKSCRGMGYKLEVI